MTASTKDDAEACTERQVPQMVRLRRPGSNPPDPEVPFIDGARGRLGVDQVVHRQLYSRTT
jgi:hypothetical protein